MNSAARLILLAFVILAPSLAAARQGQYCHRPAYSHCNCHFGYGDICNTAVSCYAEGGRCEGRCVLSPRAEKPGYSGNSTTETPAVSAEIAKTCTKLAAKAYPPRIPGNPAAGNEAGTAEAKKAYFNKCVANGGKVENQSGN
jgi:hypothetical protein